MWSSYLFDLSPEEMVCTFAARGWTESELGDEHGFVLLSRGEAGKIGRQFREFAAGQGVSFPQGHLWLDCDIAAADQAAALDKLTPWLDLFVGVGVKAAVLHPGGEEMKKQGESPERILEANVTALRAITSHLLGSSMTICLENCGQDAPELKALIRAADGEGLGICLDTGHHNLIKGNQGKFIREAGPLLQALHLHDNDGSGDQHLMPYGAGKIDWKDVFSALKEVGYRGLYNWEIPGERRGPVDVRLAKLDYLRAAWPAISSGQMYDYDDMKAVWKRQH
jgi:sugar phosphate isomerase/epimerase